MLGMFLFYVKYLQQGWLHTCMASTQGAAGGGAMGFRLELLWAVVGARFRVELQVSSLPGQHGETSQNTCSLIGIWWEIRVQNSDSYQYVVIFHYTQWSYFWFDCRVNRLLQSHYRPGQAQRVLGGRDSQICRQSTHEGGTVVSRTHRPRLPPGNIPGTHFC
jgi:hypothetical protein